MKTSIIEHEGLQIFGDLATILISRSVCRSSTPIAIFVFCLLVSCTVSMPPKNEKLQPVTPQKYWNLPAQASFPVSFDDFRQMVCTTTVFVDKTLLIRDIMDKMQQVILVNRPRRWGKSITINMLCRFFSREVDAEGQPLKTQPDRALFEGGVTCIGHHNNQKKQVELRPLKIAYEKESMKFQGTYPVVYMSWKDVDKDTFFQTKIALSKRIGAVFEKHKYLLQSQSKKITSEEKQQFQNWQKNFKAIKNNFYKNQEEMKLICLQDALVLLCQLLDKHHGRKVIILIDEYDTPFNHMLIHEIEITERKKVALMISRIFKNTLKGRFDIVHKAVLTGIHDTLLKQVLSGLNNVKICRITDQYYSQHFGFSKTEIKEQLISKMFKFSDEAENDQLLKAQENLLNRISQWYNGYKVPGKKGTFQQIYNPFAVINYLQDCVSQQCIADGKCYWTRSGSDLMIKKLFDFGLKKKQIDRILSLNTQEPLKMQFSQQINLSQFDFYDEQYLTHFLIDTGYITGYVSGQIFHATIPNEEVNKVFKKKLKKWLQKNNIFDLSIINVHDKEEFVKKIQIAFEQCKKNIGNYNEATFSNLITARLLYSKKKQDEEYSILIEKHSGDGIMDSLFLPLNAERPHAAIINEYKHTDKPQQEKRLHTQALWQIYEKNYMNYVIEQSTTNKLIERIVTRPVIMISNQMNRSMKIYTEEDISHTIEEARRITDFFKKNLQKAKRQKTKDKQQRRTRLLKQYQAEDLRELLQVICREELQASIRALNLNNQKQQPNGYLDYFKVLGSLPHINIRKRLSVIRYEPPQQQKKQKSPSTIQRQKKQEQQDLAVIRQRFTKKFPDELSLQRATLDQIFQVVHIKDKAEEIFSKLQQMKRDPRYRVCQDEEKLEKLETPVRKTDRQVLTLLVEPDPLQEAFNRIDFSAKQMILRAKQQALKKGEAQVSTKGQSSAAKAKVLLDPFLQANEKLINQARHYERTGTLFQSFGRGLLEGAIRLFSEGVQFSIFGNPVSGVNGLILGTGHTQNEGEVKRMID